MNGGIRAVEVHILTAHEATVPELCMEIAGVDPLPGSAHAHPDVLFGEWPPCQHALPPDVEEGIIQRREAFRCCTRHLDDLSQLLAAPIVELLQHFLLRVNGSTIEHQNEGVAVECSGCLPQQLADVLMQHGSIDALASLLRRVDDGRQHLLARAACDHVPALCVLGSLVCADECRLAWQHNGSCAGVTHTFVSFIQEEDLVLTDSLGTASDLGDLLTQIGRH